MRCSTSGGTSEKERNPSATTGTSNGMQKAKNTSATPVLSLDKSVTDRVARFETIKNNYRARRGLVRALVASGLKPPVPPAGQVVEALWKAGFFRLRGVLVGTIAYSCYEGILGTRLAATALRTEDADFAQYWGVSENIGESTPPSLDVIRQVDETFRKSPHVSDPFVTTRYVNSRGFKVEFLTPNRGSDTHQDKPARMKALAETGAQPLRHLNYLIHQPEKSVMLHGGGVPFTIRRTLCLIKRQILRTAEPGDQRFRAGRIDPVESKRIQRSMLCVQFAWRDEPGKVTFKKSGVRSTTFANRDT